MNQPMNMEFADYLDRSLRDHESQLQALEKKYLECSNTLRAGQVEMLRKSRSSG